ncbi:YkvA family protein [Parapusillimonas granuli]|uniref:DUF1232 domain-containing protein n=1 Tax=Parapusillimonas granuli TaxID=380911 RepID=A0A853G9W0_9BURK|nr:YkvA family protein [Parapusillimonas granuli]MBB5216469.1 uncharacterized membrane protein YkvA (DUF1232 family) [Parapusillimonas granuli]MCZ2088487.1 DUF1232 domain-containing protein [Burkholderiales bacterium]MEB2399788.1 YkvA family protein [Alcaligenaceae bacterium]NYT51536.1 DUF1232 domain-containing protein [Parapusillimonas granuli]
MDTTRYQKLFTQQGFWRKLGPRARSLGRETLEKALYLYYAVQSPLTPKWAKRVIYGALGYFILPLDAIPDLAPLVGYTDDLSVMAAALATVAFYITPDVKAQAQEKLGQWFKTPATPAYTDA